MRASAPIYCLSCQVHLSILILFTVRVPLMLHTTIPARFTVLPRSTPTQSSSVPYPGCACSPCCHTSRNQLSFRLLAVRSLSLAPCCHRQSFGNVCPLSFCMSLPRALPHACRLLMTCILTASGTGNFSPALLDREITAYIAVLLGCVLVRTLSVYDICSGRSDGFIRNDKTGQHEISMATPGSA